MRHSGRNGLQFLCCSDEAVVLFVTARGGRGYVLIHGSILLQARPAKRGSAQIPRVRPMRLRPGWRLRRAGELAILLGAAILWDRGLLPSLKPHLPRTEAALAQLAFYSERFD